MPFSAKELRDALEAEAEAFPAASTEPATLVRRRASQRMRTVAVPTVGILVVAVLAAVFVRPERQPAIRLTAGPSALSAVVAATREAGTARVGLTFNSTFRQDGSPSTIEVPPFITVAGDGVIDFRSGDGRIVLDAGRGQLFETLSVGGVTYVKYPNDMRKQIGVATPWVTIEKTAGGDTSQAGTPYFVPDEAIRALEPGGKSRNSNLREVGREKIRGQQTLHYKGRVPIAPEEGLTEERSSVEVWIDFSGILRRVRTATTEVQDNLTITTVQTYEYYDFGLALTGLVRPQDDQVTSAAELDQLRRSAAAARPYPDEALPKYCEGRALLRQAAAQDTLDLDVVRQAIDAIDAAIDSVEGSSASDYSARSRMQALNASARSYVSLAIRSADGAELDNARARLTTTLGNAAEPC